ncbi:hypothetical protein Cha6605_2217 [Chamaesiphon minutus PCC 6605]|uniref:Uncharacterized protein n=2 Tax=Chamaesiphon TaxID=217161 RepID=K9UES0_CHAP6|nr:hypothetical protein Cha6605_2217 [Chamaesiphon minutus PCC 6605]
MDRPNRSIFREDAIRRYVASREEIVLPRWISPSSFLYLWVLLGLLFGGIFMAWFAKVPVSAAGKAMVVRSRDRTQGVREKVVIAAFFPTQTRSHLQAHQPLRLHFEGLSSLDRSRLSRLKLKDKPVIRSPEDIRDRFGLTASTALQINQPVAVAIVPLDPADLHLPTSAYIGSTGKAEIVVGSQRLLSLLPWIGSHFQTP